jgi:hypothetical protein
MARLKPVPHRGASFQQPLKPWGLEARATADSPFDFAQGNDRKKGEGKGNSKSRDRGRWWIGVCFRMLEFRDPLSEPVNHA